MSWLAYLSLPLIGALIGYLTNHIAIRMLFRPLRPWRLAGLKVPLTPGVIPAARHRLADNIGKMVGDHLLTPRDLRRALGEDDFQHNLRLLIRAQTDAFMNTPLGPPESVVPETFRSYFRVGVKVLRWRFLKHLHQHLDSPEFAAAFETASDEHFTEIRQRRLRQLWPAEQRTALCHQAGEQLQQLLAAPAFSRGMESYLEHQLYDLLHSNRSPAELLPEHLLKALLDRLEAEAPRLLEQLGELLETPEARARIADGLGRTLHRFSSSLGPMGAILGNLLTPETVKDKLHSWLGAAGAGSGRWLLDETTRRKLAAILRQEAEKFCQRPLADLLSGVAPDQLARARQELTKNLVKLLSRPESGEFIGKLLADAADAHQDLTLEEILSRFWGPAAPDRAQQLSRRELLRLLRSRRVKRMLDRLLVDLLEKRLLSRPLGRPADLLPAAVRAGIEDYLLGQVNQLLEREVPPLLEAINIRQIITRKINQLDLLQLEGLLLTIMQDQFKYINLFGALLGFFIGLLNLLILLSF